MRERIANRATVGETATYENRDEKLTTKGWGIKKAD